MPSVVLLKPASNTLELTGGASPELGTGGSIYIIKARSIRSRYTNPMHPVMGDGDESATFAGTDYIEGVVQMRGVMRGAQLIGILNMVASSDSFLENDPTFTLWYWLGNDGAYRGIKHPAIMKQIRVNWKRDAVNVGIAMTMFKNGQLDEVTTTPQGITAGGYATAKPATRTGEVLVSEGLLKMGTATADDLIIQLHSAQLDFSTVLEDDTGDGDVDQHFASNMVLSMQGRLTGFVPAGSVLGIDKDDAVLNSSDGKSTPVFTGVELWLEADSGSGEGALAMDLVVETYRIGVDRKGPFIPVELMVRKQSAVTSGAETLVEDT